MKESMGKVGNEQDQREDRGGKVGSKWSKDRRREGSRVESFLKKINNIKENILNLQYL